MSADENAGLQLETGRAADREWRAARLATIDAREKLLRQVAQGTEQHGGPAIRGLALAIGTCLIVIGLGRAGPYFKVDQPELLYGLIAIIGSFAVPANLSYMATRLRRRIDTMREREGLTAGDLPRDEDPTGVGA